MRGGQSEDERIYRVAMEIAMTERRLTRLEFEHMAHGRRIGDLEIERDAIRAAIWKMVRGLLVLAAGIALDMHLNGGAWLKHFFPG